MIIMLIVIGIVAILLGISIFGGFYKDADYIYAYDKNGNDTRYFKDIEFKDDSEKKFVLEGILSKKQYEDLDPKVLEDVVKYDKVPYKRTVKYHVKYRLEMFDNFFAASIIAFIFAGIGLIAGFFCIGNNTTYAIEESSMKYEEATVELEYNQKSLFSPKHQITYSEMI